MSTSVQQHHHRILRSIDYISSPAIPTIRVCLETQGKTYCLTTNLCIPAQYQLIQFVKSLSFTNNLRHHKNLHGLKRDGRIGRFGLILIETSDFGLKTSLIVLALVSVVLVIAASVTTFYVMVAYGNLKQYGRKCVPSVPMSCGTTDLTCLASGVCGCKSSDYKWDQQQGLCVALVDGNAECRKWQWDGSYAVPCTDNAVCNDNNRCECLNYFVVVEHECIASYDGICSKSTDCNQREFLFCGKSGKCECRPGTVRHQKANAFGCYVKIGETCADVMKDLCVDPNSECTKEEICRCNKDKGYIPSRENTACGKTANNTCFTDIDCADTLSCQKSIISDRVGVCYCSDAEILNDTQQKCLIKAGKRCDAADPKQCVDNASCKHSTCVCNRGYGLDEANGLCLGTHGTLCETSANCLVSHYFQCIGGICDCDGNHTNYSQTTGSCFGNVTDTECIDDLNCDQKRMKCDQTTKMCTCLTGFETDNNFCYGAHGSDCTETSDCFRQQMLTCIEGSCGCNSASEEWDESECKLQFEQRCEKAGSRTNMKCVGNLTCLIDPLHASDVFKICGCETKYVVSENKRLCVNKALSINGNLLVILLVIIGFTFL